MRIEEDAIDDRVYRPARLWTRPLAALFRDHAGA